MNDIFDTIKEDILSQFRSWIQVSDSSLYWTIEDFSYETGVIAEQVKPHCVKCVAVNQCWFKNEENKKPERFNYNKSSYIEISFLKYGLYHPNCHCKEIGISSPYKNQISIIELDKKMKFAIKDKLGLFMSFGYHKDDEKQIFSLIENLSKQNYCLGNYEKVKINPEMIKYGFKINVKIDFPGKGNKSHKIYPLKSCYMIFPKGKLKCNTPIGGWTK